MNKMLIFAFLALLIGAYVGIRKVIETYGFSAIVLGGFCVLTLWGISRLYFYGVSHKNG